MEFKDKLRALRQQQGLSQQALADAIFISRSAVAKWENGLGMPSEASMQALTEYFGVNESYFATEEPEKVIARQDKTIRRMLMCIAAIVLVLVTTFSPLVVPYLLQHPPRIGFSSQSAAGISGDDPCVRTENMDFYLAGTNVKDDNGQVIGYSVSRITAVRRFGLLYYMDTLQWSCRYIYHDGLLIGTLATYQDRDGFHNVFITNASCLLMPLMEFDFVTANETEYAAQKNAYFFTEAPVEALEIEGFRLNISKEANITEM